MPRSLDPDYRLTLVLASDVDKPKETQPRFFAKTLTVAALKRMQDKKDSGDFDSLMDALMDGLIGWENMGGLEFNRDNVAKVLDIQEVEEVISFLVGQGALTESERKK